MDGLRVVELADRGGVAASTVRFYAAPKASLPVARVFRVTASESSLARVRRWRDEGTILRAYLSYDGALVLGDPLLDGNACREPATTVTWQASKRTACQDQSPSEDS